GEVALGTRSAIVDSNTVSYEHLLRWIKRQLGDQSAAPIQFDSWDSATTLLVLTVVGLVLLAFFVLRPNNPVTYRQKGYRWVLLLVLSVAGGVVLAGAGLLAPALNGPPTLGTRYLHFASYGTLLVLLGVGVTVATRFRLQVPIGAILALIFVGWGFQISS